MKHILFTKKVHTEGLIPIKEYNSQASAEEAGNYIYVELSLDTIIVAEAEFDHCLNKVCYKPVYKRIRACKHPNLQGDLFEGLMCQDCKIVVKKLEAIVIVSKVEDIKEEDCIDDEDDEEEDTLVEITEQYKLQRGG